MIRTPFERQCRNSARISLYVSLALMGVFVLVGAKYLETLKPTYDPEPWKGIDFAQIEEVRLLQEYLRVDTSQPDADERAGARFLAEQLEAAGIEAHIEELGDTHANVWAILEGKDPKALVLHNHIDTDPIPYPDLWRRKPTSGDIEGPWIHGRGAYDMKGIAIAQLVSFIELKRSGLPLERSVIFLATGSEEIGSDFGMKWILSQHPELAERFWGMLTEGGALENRSLSDLKYWGIEFSQKRWADVTFCSASRERLEVLQEELRERDNTPPASVRIAPEVFAFLKAYGPSRDKASLRQLLVDPSELERNPALVQIHKLPKYFYSMMTDETRPSIVIDEVDGGYELVVRFFLLPGSDFKEVRERLLPAWMIHDLDFTVDEPVGNGVSSPLDHPLYQQVVRSLRAEYPDAPIGPYFLPWTATDSRFVRSDSVVSYGLSPFLVPLTETLQIGRPNERLNLLGYLNGINVFRRLVFKLSAGAEAQNLWIPPKREAEI